MTENHLAIYSEQHVLYVNNAFITSTGCLALKFQDLLSNKFLYQGNDWKLFFIHFQSNIILDRKMYKAIKNCSILCDKLEISAERKFKVDYLIETFEFDFLASESYKELG